MRILAVIPAFLAVCSPLNGCVYISDKTYMNSLKELEVKKQPSKTTLLAKEKT